MGVGPVVVAQWDVDGEQAAGAGESDVEESSFLFQALGRAEGQVGGEVAVARSDDVDYIPLESLRGVDRAEDEKVVVELGCARVVGGRGGWVERDVREEG